MKHVNDWCFREIYKGGLWDDDLHVCAPMHITRVRRAYDVSGYTATISNSSKSDFFKHHSYYRTCAYV